MSNSKTIQRLTICSFFTLFFGCEPVTFADTTIRDQATQGKLSRNAIEIEHGCENDVTGKTLPVIAQSVVIPTVNPVVTRSDGSPTALSAEIEDSSGLAGKINLVQDKSIFKSQNETYDANGNVIGFNGSQGKLQVHLLGVVPFQFSPVTFKATSCANSLIVKIAIADICKKKFPPDSHTANLWIPNVTPKFETAADNEGIGHPAILTITRGTSLPASCGGLGYDVTVTPSDEDVDAHLPFKGWK